MDKEKTLAQMARYNKWQLAGFFFLGLLLFPLLVLKKVLFGGRK